LDTDEIQHVPCNWTTLITNNNKGTCWFPFTKTDKQDKYFGPTKVTKMILQCMTPSVYDGRYYRIEKVAGPFSKYIF